MWVRWEKIYLLYNEWFSVAWQHLPTICSSLNVVWQGSVDFTQDRPQVPYVYKVLLFIQGSTLTLLSTHLDKHMEAYS